MPKSAPFHSGRRSGAAVRAVAVVLALASLPIMAIPALGQVAEGISLPGGVQGPRTVTELANGWRFLDGDLADAARPDLPEDGWEAVSVPHSWNRVGYYRHEQGGSNTAANVKKRQGVGWYRLHFTPPASPLATGKDRTVALASPQRQWLEFDAASRTAKVWLNGTYLGEHRGGFSRFRLDATAALKPGADNLLVVRVDNTQPTAGAPTADVLPLTGDFFVHGGLYRPVRLITAAPLHIDLADFGGAGVYATTTLASAESATVQVRLRLANDSARLAKAAVRLSLRDQSGHEVATTTLPAGVAAGTVAALDAVLTVSAPHLWQGTADPTLYQLVAEVAGGDGAVVDRVEQAIGLRTMAFDPARGFLLNGAPYRLRGVGYHQDRDGKGWALSPADIAEDVATLREMGVNSIRLTHYQHGQAIHDLADRAGMVVWDEIPLVSAWTLGKELEPAPALVANARQQLTELVRQNQNHAASAIWSIANEVDFGNSMPMFLTGQTGGKIPDPLPLLGELNALAHALDPSRPSALATCCEANRFGPGTTIPVTAVAADLGGANRYFGWYYGAPDQLGPNLDELRAARPAQPLSLTEYGAGGALTIHTDNVLGGPVDSRGAGQPEEYQSYIHEVTLPQIDARPWLYASWLWNSFDFATRIRTEGDGQDMNTKGLVAYDHRTRKDAWYFYKANWNPAPMVHITGKRYVDRAYPVTDIKVYSNLATTELLLNGRSLGSKADCPQRVCVWSAVALDGGGNELVARGAGVEAGLEDRATWTLAPERLGSIVIDTGTLVAGKGNSNPGGRMIGSDNWFTGGKTASLDTPADYGRPAKPAEIAGTKERDALATVREGTFSYRIPVPDGRYSVTLWFATSATQKPGAFNVASGGKTVLRNYQPAIPASGAVAEARTFTVKAKGGVALDFVAGAGEARVAMIELKRLR